MCPTHPVLERAYPINLPSHTTGVKLLSKACAASVLETRITPNEDKICKNFLRWVALRLSLVVGQHDCAI